MTLMGFVFPTIIARGLPAINATGCVSRGAQLELRHRTHEDEVILDVAPLSAITLDGDLEDWRYGISRGPRCNSGGVTSRRSRRSETDLSWGRHSAGTAASRRADKSASYDADPRRKSPLSQHQHRQLTAASIASQAARYSRKARR
jgi:hypothetical protein